MLYNWISLLLSWVEKIMIDLNEIVKCIEAVYYRYETRLQWIWLLTWTLKDIWTNIQQCIPQFERCSHANQQDIRKCKHKSPREENKHCKTAQLTKNKHAGNKEVKFKSHRKKKKYRANQDQGAMWHLYKYRKYTKHNQRYRHSRKLFYVYITKSRGIHYEFRYIYFIYKAENPFHECTVSQKPPI